MKKLLLILLLIASTGILRAYDFQVDSLYYKNIRAIADTTDQPTTIAVSTESDLSNAFLTATSGSIIQLTSDIAMNSTLWLGTTEMGTTSGDGSRSLTLDLNGHALTRANGMYRLLDLTHGELTIMSSVDGGQILDQATGASIQDLICVTGSTLKDVNPMAVTEGFYSRLVVSAGVRITAQKNAIEIDRVGAVDGHTIQYGTDVYDMSMSSSQYGAVANGVRLEICGEIYAEKCCIRLNGNLRAPTTDGENLRSKTTSTQYANYDDYVVEATDVDYVPYIYICSSAVLTSSETTTGATTLYASGYANWHIDGATCSGNIGLYVKSGELRVMGATISSSCPEYIAANSPTHSGVTSSGSAVVIEPSLSGQGPISLSFSQNAVVSAESGYAIEEVFAEDTMTHTNVTDLSFANCTLQGGDAGVIRLSTATSDESILYLDEETVTIIEKQTHVQYVTWEYFPEDSTLAFSGQGIMEDYSVAVDAVRSPWDVNSNWGNGDIYAHIIFPQGLTYIGSEAFTECNYLQSVTCYAVTPPAMGSYAFNMENFAGPLYVPAGSVTVYQNDSSWSHYFSNIRAISCDSVYEFSETFNLCGADSFTWHGRVYTTSGIYVDTLQSREGCDSIVTLELNLLPTYFYADTISISAGTTYYWHGASYGESGVYYDSLQSVSGCDSICCLNLVVNAPTNPSGTCGENLTWEFNPADSVLTISGSGMMADWNQSSAVPWHDYTAQITQVALPDGLTTIGASAFAGCWNIRVMTIPNSVTGIGDAALSSCYRLETVILGDNVTALGNQVFGDSYNLATINFPESLTSIGRKCFYYCTGLTSIHLQGNVTTIGDRAFMGCSGIQSITSEAVTPPIVGTEAFDSIASTITVYIPQASWSAYRAADGWNYFSIFRAISCDIAYESSETFQICATDSFMWHGNAYTKSGIYHDTLQSQEGCDSICTLQLTVNPNYLIEDIVSVREDKLPYMWQGEAINQSGNYRKEYTASTGCDSVHTLHFTVTELPIYTVNVVADHGHVNGTGTYPEGTQITLTAVPDEGFEFQMWSDGSETNPKEFIVTRDTTLRALFYMPEVEQEVTVDSIETNSVTITWDTVPGATLYELRIYKNGELVVTLQVDRDNNILDASFAGPERIIARKDSTGGSSETLQVEVGGLEPGQDYTYSLDALDDDRSYVGAQSGSFTTEEEPIDGLDTLFDDRRTAPRKVLRDGNLYILLPDGTLYDARGQSL